MTEDPPRSQFRRTAGLKTTYIVSRDGQSLGSVYKDDQGWHGFCDCGEPIAMRTNGTTTREAAAALLVTHHKTHEDEP